MTITSRRALVVGAWVTTAVLGGAALTGVAMAASASPNPSATGASPGASSAAGGHVGHDGGLRALGNRVLHGEFTVKTKNGVKVYDTEIGVITAVTPTSVEVKATDGFTQTWTLDSSTHVRVDGTKSTIADLKTGQTVRLLGPSSGGTATAQVAVVRPTA